MASASRDRLIHVFDACREYSFVHTLDDHSSSITAIRFLKMPPRPGVENSVQIASCGADKSIIFRDITSDHKGGLEFTRGNHIVGKTTLYDMETDVRFLKAPSTLQNLKFGPNLNLSSVIWPFQKLKNSKNYTPLKVLKNIADFLFHEKNLNFEFSRHNLK